MIYNNGLLVAKNSIENGELNPLIGLWAIHLIFILLILLFYQFRQGNLGSFIAKITPL